MFHYAGTLFGVLADKNVSKGCKEKTTFFRRFGTFRFDVMPFGFLNATF